MIKVSFKYTPELVNWIKQSGSGSRWNPAEKVWEVPDPFLEDLRAQAESMGVELKIAAEEGGTGRPITRIPAQAIDRQKAEAMGYIEWDEQPQAQVGIASGTQLMDGDIRLRRSRDGRFVLMSMNININMNMIADSKDVEDLMAGTNNSVKFRILPPRPRTQPGASE
jgi:hypothetical protein